MSKRWKCAIIADSEGDIMVGTNGDVLRIRRPNLNSIEVKLLDCQNTPPEKMNRAAIDFDPMFKSVDEMKAFIEEQRTRMDEADQRAKRFGLKKGIQAALHGLADDQKKGT